MPSVYRLDLAKTGRSGCTNTECKKAGIKIEKGELRFATQVEIQEYQSWKYKHWGCVTPQVIGNLKEVIEDNLEYLDGYDEIDEQSQAKVRKALEVGHVADEDWKGDLERNRPGKKGFRSPAAVKKKMAEEEDDGSPTPRKPKKRSRAKKEEDDQDVEKPLAKKPKATQKRGKKKLKEEQDEDADSAAASVPAPLNRTGGRGKESDTNVKIEDTDSVAAPVPLKKNGGRGKKNDTKVKVEDEWLKNESGEEGATANVSQRVALKREATESDQDSETVSRASQLIPKVLQKPTDEAANGERSTFEGKKEKRRAKAAQDGHEDLELKTKPQTNRVTRSQRG